MATTFLTAEWRKLIFANYTLNRQLLEPLVPYGTELDEFEGICYGSLVGFYFQRVKLLGQLAIPFHTEFEEFNLRFYVRRKTPTWFSASRRLGRRSCYMYCHHYCGSSNCSE